MSKEKRRVPKLRFPGFTEDWEQRKLSDISTKVTTKNVDVHYTETLTNSAEQGIISQVDFFDKEISNKDNINGYYIVDNNDFIYNPRISTLAPVGPINRNKLNRTGIMSPLYTVFRSSNVDLGFLEWYFQSSHWHRYMKLNGDSGARADRIAIKDSTFFEMPIKIPVNIKEQVLIGETLEKFNQYITLHQRKLDNLKLKKKALLQKLFPKNGERYPELRFPEFTDSWEQRKLSDLMEVTSVKRIHQADWTDSGVRFFRARDIVSSMNNEEIDNPVFISKDKYEEYSRVSGKVIEGDLLVTGVGTIGVPYLIKDTTPLYFKDGNIIWFKNNNTLNGSYFYYCFQNSYIQNQIYSASGKGTVGTYTIENGKKTSIRYPSLKEQIKIGNLLDTMTTMITLHQRKLDHLQLQKKALLQQMFV